MSDVRSLTISVIIPTLNEEQALPETLRHTLTLGFEEILVVDGGSQDRTMAHATRLQSQRGQSGAGSSAPRLVLLPSEAGRATQMNYGAAVCTGDILLFLHADTHLPANASILIRNALSHRHLVGGRFDVQFERDHGIRWLISRLMNLRSRWSGIATGDQAIFVRRSAFESLGGFADVPLMEDIDFSRRLKHLGALVSIRTKLTTSFRRWEACGPLRTIFMMWGLRFLYWMGVPPDTLNRHYRAVR